MTAYKLTLYRVIIRVLANIFMLAAVFLGAYRASRVSAWPCEAVFCLWFFGVTIPVWILALRLDKLLRAKLPVSAIPSGEPVFSDESRLN